MGLIRTGSDILKPEVTSSNRKWGYIRKNKNILYTRAKPGTLLVPDNYLFDDQKIDCKFSAMAHLWGRFTLNHVHVYNTRFDEVS